LFVFIIAFKPLKFYCNKFKNKKHQNKYIKRNSIFKKMKTFKINIPPPKKQIKTIAFLIKKNSKSLSKSQQKF
jgi:hypothetical protein